MDDATTIGSDRIAVITVDRIDEEAVQRAVTSPSSGALVIFSGIVRNHDAGRGVESLDYRAHPAAERMLAACCAEIAASSGLRVAAAHRIGALRIGDVALYVAVSAAHRREAFEACEQLVEQIKATVPIWKRQHFADGASEWVGL